MHRCKSGGEALTPEWRGDGNEESSWNPERTAGKGTFSPSPCFSHNSTMPFISCIRLTEFVFICRNGSERPGWFWGPVVRTKGKEKRGWSTHFVALLCVDHCLCPSCTVLECPIRQGMCWTRFGS